MRISPILGPDGQPITVDSDNLRTHLSRATAFGITNPYNRTPQLRLLSPRRLAAIYSNINIGEEIADYAELAEEMEEHDAHYRSCLQQRKLGVTGRQWQVEPASDSAMDTEIAAVVTDILSAPQFGDAMLDMLDGIAKGYSVTEIVWGGVDGRWLPVSYHWVDTRLITFSRDDGKTPLLRAEESSGVPLGPAKFICHNPKTKSGLPIRGGIVRPVMSMLMLKSYSVRDWWSFMEVFGLPLRVGTYGPDATEEDIKTLSTAIARIASDAGCVIPESMKVDFISAGNRTGDKIFISAVEWADRQISKMVLGATMTTDDNSSLSQSQVHSDVREELIADDARQLALTVSRDLVRWIVALNWGAVAAPKIALSKNDNEDATAILDRAERGLRLGLTVSRTWLQSQLGLQPPKDSDDTLSGRENTDTHAEINAADDGDWRAVTDATV